jgi:hypothetical protein
VLEKLVLRSRIQYEKPEAEFAGLPFGFRVSLHSPYWPHTTISFLSLSSAKTPGMCHHTQIKISLRTDNLLSPNKSITGAALWLHKQICPSQLPNFVSQT